MPGVVLLFASCIHSVKKQNKNKQTKKKQQQTNKQTKQNKKQNKSKAKKKKTKQTNKQTNKIHGHCSGRVLNQSRQNVVSVCFLSFIV